MLCYAELIAECQMEDENICQFMTEALLEERIEFDLAFLVLSNQGSTGMAYLYDIGNRDIC